LLDLLITRTQELKRHVPRLVALLIVGPIIACLSLYMAFAIFFWLPWPVWIRVPGCIMFPALVAVVWIKPGRTQAIRQLLAITAIFIVVVAYFTKSPVPQDWVDLQDRNAEVAINGDLVTISNFRDAQHAPGQTPVPRWTIATFDVSKLQTADLIIQPFGTNKAFAHVLISFGFADGRHVVVSMESRQAKGQAFSPVSGFFRHDELYPELATERDLFWERLSRTPPDALQIYPILKSPQVLRIYFKRVLVFVDQVHDRPQFYSTLSESCMTALINLAPESFASVHWYDLRRWIPGYALPLFQQLGLVDSRLPADIFAQQQTIRDNLLPPRDFATDEEWSLYVRHGLVQKSDPTARR
jgi:hypothetical protein